MGRLRTANRRRRRVADLPFSPPFGHDPLSWLSRASTGRNRGAARGRRPEIIGKALIPRGGELVLKECGGQFSIEFEGDELMGTIDYASEDKLAWISRQSLAQGVGPVLIGGLGMGFTLRAALEAWAEPAEVVVAELVPGVVEWARGPLAHIFGDSLQDPRVSIDVRDVHDVIAEADAAFEAILLDVDNGPDGFMRPDNDRLYCAWGLRSAFAALKPDGILAVWSAYADDRFGAELEEVGFEVDERTLPAPLSDVAGQHTIWIARKPLGRRQPV